MEEHKLPVWNYYLDESDPDIVVLRREDGAFVAAFSASGATREGICEAAMEDYRAIIQAHGVSAWCHLRKPEVSTGAGCNGLGPFRVLKGAGPRFPSGGDRRES